MYAYIKKVLIIVFFFTTHLFSWDQERKQALVVIAENELSTNGHMWFFERENGHWKSLCYPKKVTLGKAGLAWGLVGLHPFVPSNQTYKMEGDGKSPAGIYEIEQVFGLSTNTPSFITMNYQPFIAGIEAVDDPKSKYYNQIVDVFKTTQDWDSTEKLSEIPLYKYGAVISYNSKKPNPSLGSCIYIHLWKGPNKPTAGCTAMDEKDLIKVLSSLKAEKKPVLIQLTKKDYEKFKKEWNLPNIN